MAVPARARRTARRPRRFELRATALYFALLAVIIALVGAAARTAAAAAVHRPAWAAALALMGVGAAMAGCRGKRRISAARIVRRSAEALDEATQTAVEALDAASPAPAVDLAPAGAGACSGRLGTEPTVLLPEAVPEAPADTVEIAYEALDPDEFEQAVAELCRRDGCLDVDVVGGAGDLGADVVARTPDGRSVVIQCKRYCDGNRVGSQDLQRFGGTCFTVHGADVAVVVTTSDFTAPALDYAEQCGIVCVDGPQLRRWQEGAGPRPWEAQSSAG
ncbi:restriction endonuclease [Streptomyces triticiradicis]|uniref:Restriction endonuclease n=1 Tax=Streptomyces triticiradicis TaxID=2651189 RepID=A0A7J5D2D8_9ACTN|nr:restriction endonuclease [Streptomyces triticiradicis]KAB1977581.1 restriction endonuclease [Streptomyces triticiradicis]